MKKATKEISDALEGVGYGLEPGQYYQQYMEDPARTLISEVIKKTVMDYLDFYNNRHLKRFKDAEAWIFSDEATNGNKFTFIEACDAIGADYLGIRKELTDLTEEKRKAMRKRFRYVS